MGGEDAQQQLHPLLYLLDAAEPFIHPRTHPRRDRLAFLLIPSDLVAVCSTALQGRVLAGLRSFRQRRYSRLPVNDELLGWDASVSR
jgi:hypothetical protein